ncbi:MAG: hypothetical protein AVDCRST_MAG67-1762, partial [uncultured Solirubrobacteraceae bacterium]
CASVAVRAARRRVGLPLAGKRRRTGQRRSRAGASTETLRACRRSPPQAAISAT